MTPKEEYIELYERMCELCNDQGWGDPFSYARSKEIHMSCVLKHQISETLAGADAIDSDGECEYKSTIAKTINATYNGISVFDTWDEQVDYLINDKIKKYKNHYVARYSQDGKIAECYQLSGDDVFDIILPKLKRQYESTSKRKDPRLGATISQKEIYKYGKKIK